MNLTLSVQVLKKSILLFWALYFLIVVASNITDGLRAVGILADSITFTSGNYGLMAKVVAIYHTPTWLLVIMYIGVIIWEGLASFTFFSAFSAYNKTPIIGKHIYTAFILSFGLWAAFILMDEFFIAFHVADLERSHQMLMITQLVTLFAMVLLPDED